MVLQIVKMRCCAIEGCANKRNSRKQIRFFPFPTDEHVHSLWAAVCKREVALRFVCEDHFDEESWSMKDRLLNMPISKRRLLPGAVPTLNLSETVSVDVPAAEQEKARKELIADALSEYDRRQQEYVDMQAALEVAAAPITSGDGDGVFVVEYVAQTQYVAPPGLILE